MTAAITVGEAERDRDRLRFHVTVDNRPFQVTVHDEEAATLAPGVEPARLIQESFRFLLEHEPVTSILPSFDLSVIEGYFPGYGREMSARLQG